ncbi:MAG: NAD-dependent epimerase/dehydratase family protein [Pseudomonadota bacterium]
MIGVIGAHGFIGQSLVDHYLTKHKPITAFVRKRRNTDRLTFGPLPKIQELSIGAPFALELFSDIDTLVLAASATNPRSRNSRANEVTKNVLPHIRFVENLRNTDVKHLIFISSGGTIYGDTNGAEAIPESYPTQPITDYAYGKQSIEHVLRRLWRDQGRWLTVLRPSNPVGIHQMKSINSQGLIPTVFNNILANQTITVLGDGSTVRDYFSVDELCALIELLAEQKAHCHRLFNVGSGQGCSIKDVIAIGSEILGRPARIHFKMNEQPVIQTNILDTQRLRHAFGWQSMKSVADLFRDLKQREDHNTRIKALLANG